MHVQYGMCGADPRFKNGGRAGLFACGAYLQYQPADDNNPPFSFCPGGSINSSKLTIPGAGIERHLPQATQSKKKERRKREGGMVGLKVGGGGVCQDQLESLLKVFFGLDRKV